MDDKIQTSETKEKIFEAALNLFSKNGFHASTTRAIAQDANVNEVTLFRLFHSKTKLFKEVLHHVNRVGFNSQKYKRLSQKPEEILRYIINDIMDTVERFPREFRIMHHAILDKVDGFEEEFVKFNQEQLLELLEGTFSKLQELGKIGNQIAPRFLSALLHSTIMGAASQRVLSRTFPIKKMDRDELCNSVLCLFIRT